MTMIRRFAAAVGLVALLPLAGAAQVPTLIVELEGGPRLAELQRRRDSQRRDGHPLLPLRPGRKRAVAGGPAVRHLEPGSAARAPSPAGSLLHQGDVGFGPDAALRGGNFRGGTADGGDLHVQFLSSLLPVSGPARGTNVGLGRRDRQGSGRGDRRRARRCVGPEGRPGLRAAPPRGWRPSGRLAGRRRSVATRRCGQQPIRRVESTTTRQRGEPVACDRAARARFLTPAWPGTAWRSTGGCSPRLRSPALLVDAPGRHRNWGIAASGT
jgi:hypothetical protein